jgi:hypothetical protein
MTARRLVLVLFPSIAAILLACGPTSGPGPQVYQCVCRDGNNVTEVTSTTPCTQTPGCIAGPGGKAAPRGADGGDAGGGG